MGEGCSAIEVWAFEVSTGISKARVNGGSQPHSRPNAARASPVTRQMRQSGMTVAPIFS